jgi:hypothetical protein
MAETYATRVCSQALPRRTISASTLLAPDSAGRSRASRWRRVRDSNPEHRVTAPTVSKHVLNGSDLRRLTRHVSCQHTVDRSAQRFWSTFAAMGTTPTGPNTAVGRRILELLERRPVVGGSLLMVIGVALVTCAIVWESDPPAGLIVGAGGGAGVVLAFVGARSLILAFQSRHRRQV